MNRTNVIARHRAPLNKDVREYRRYSNGTVIATGDVFQTIPGSDDYETLPADYYSGTTSSGSSVNWGGLLGQLINGTTSVLTSMFGRTEAAQLNAYQTMYKQEQRTNTILWVVIGLVVAMGIVLVLRKTK